MILELNEPKTFIVWGHASRNDEGYITLIDKYGDEHTIGGARVDSTFSTFHLPAEYVNSDYLPGLAMLTINGQVRRSIELELPVEEAGAPVSLPDGLLVAPASVPNPVSINGQWDGAFGPVSLFSPDELFTETGPNQFIANRTFLTRISLAGSFWTNSQDLTNKVVELSFSGPGTDADVSTHRVFTAEDSTRGGEQRFSVDTVTIILAGQSYGFGDVNTDINASTSQISVDCFLAPVAFAHES